MLGVGGAFVVVAITAVVGLLIARSANASHEKRPPRSRGRDRYRDDEFDDYDDRPRRRR